MDLGTDIYKITNLVNEIQKRYIDDLDEDTLSMGMYGYLNEIHSTSLQNAIIMASEWGNEAFPIRAKFEKTILTNAITYNITDINAIPSTMKVMIGFVERELQEKMINNKFVINKSNKFMIGEYEFHLDYDIIITMSRLIDGTVAYSAMYDIKRKNPLSDILNPYLQTPLRLNINNSKFVFIVCDIRQVIYDSIYKKIISNSIFENKTIDFEFENQLACFDILIKDNDEEIYITPVLEGLSTLGISNFCTYSYIDTNTIRIKFNKDSYEPSVNTNIEIILQTTEGSNGNFSYKEDVLSSLNSQKNGYTGTSILIRPVTDSVNGRDRKSIKDLKQIIPKEILSRGNITNNKDLENYFNMVDDNNKLIFYKRRDNQFERLYYAYMIVKDDDDNIVPTNTISLKLSESDLLNNSDRYILNPGSTIVYDINYGVINNNLSYEEILNKEQTGFVYSSPFITVINKYPLSVSYYLDVINRDYDFEYTFIEQSSEIQFISNYMRCEKNYLNNRNYEFKLSLTQNINIDRNLVVIDDDGIIYSKIKPVIIFSYNDFHYYKFGEITNFDISSYTYDVLFELETDNIINKENCIKIKNLIPQGNTTPIDIFLPEKVPCEIVIFLEKEDKVRKLNINNQENIIPNMDNYVLVNKYKTIESLNLFYNYSNTINSKVSVSEGNNFTIKGMPVIKYSYLNDLFRCDNFINYIQFRKTYIDSALNSLENSFNIDLKFFNTYGPSKMFRIGHNKEYLDKVNLTFKFLVKLLPTANNYIIDNIYQEVRGYIEDLNEDKISIHISNLITHITNKFSNDIKFIEFEGINNYNSLYQYLERDDIDLIEDVPEFININLTKDLNLDINIVLV